VRRVCVLRWWRKARVERLGDAGGGAFDLREMLLREIRAVRCRTARLEQELEQRREVKFGAAS
jgi:hypothetical protein